MHVPDRASASSWEWFICKLHGSLLEALNWSSPFLKRNHRLAVWENLTSGMHQHREISHRKWAVLAFPTGIVSSALLYKHGICHLKPNQCFWSSSEVPGLRALHSFLGHNCLDLVTVWGKEQPNMTLSRTAHHTRAVPCSVGESWPKSLLLTVCHGRVIHSFPALPCLWLIPAVGSKWQAACAACAVWLLGQQSLAFLEMGANLIGNASLQPPCRWCSLPEVAVSIALMQPRSPVATVDLCIHGATIHGGET